jgi:hypothetical protein
LSIIPPTPAIISYGNEIIAQEQLPAILSHPYKLVGVNGIEF